MADPEPYIDLDPQAPLALLDQLQAGKRLMLISNSEWEYARTVMAYAYDRFLPDDMTWRDLFELVIVGARKPGFFLYDLPLFSIADEEAGLLRPVPSQIPEPGAYLGGDATKVEEYLGLSGAAILYVGDHIFADVKISKSSLRWRTALILRELEDELAAIDAFRDSESILVEMMEEKIQLETALSRIRLALQRLKGGYAETATAVGQGTRGRDPARPRGLHRTRRAHRAAGARGLPARKPALGRLAALRQRQEPPRQSDRTIGGHLHLEGLELPLRHPVRLPAQPSRQHAARSDRLRPCRCSALCTRSPPSASSTRGR